MRGNRSLGQASLLEKQLIRASQSLGETVLKGEPGILGNCYNGRARLLGEYECSELENKPIAKSVLRGEIWNGWMNRIGRNLSTLG
jgi:hypothetical protein